MTVRVKPPVYVGVEVCTSVSNCYFSSLKPGTSAQARYAQEYLSQFTIVFIVFIVSKLSRFFHEQS